MTKTSRLVLAVLPFIGLGACAGGGGMRSESVASYQTSDGAGSGAPSARAYGGAEESAPSDDVAPAPPIAMQPGTSSGQMAQRIREAPEPEPTLRPGLGTEFGEQRQSQIHYVSFERGSSAPFATVALHYNDSRGVSAMVAHDLGNGGAMSPVGVDPRGEITISVVDEYDRPLPALSAGGRVYIVGEAGRRYSIAVRNNGPRRYEIVASVDGLDVMDGRDASFDKRGYIVAPHQSFTIEGFRTSESQVAAFRFGSVRDSYAARTGSARNVGVIGVALFSEIGVSYYDENEIHTRQSADPFPGHFALPPR
ncbi:MAG: hypothetical protein HYY06_04915 [Deltaproteobacteria bacterium]|nr:hypothetical protein [Deltaproteobacteria bacterium]